MRVAVIGGSGFVGTYIVGALVDAGHEPSLLVRSGSEHKIRRAGTCRITVGELASAEAIRTVLDGCDAVIYNVGILREHRRQGTTFEAMHYEGAVRVIDAAKEAGVSRFVMMSANGVRRPGTPYQETKHRADEYLKSGDFDYTIFRPSVIFGDPRGNLEIASQLYRDMILPPVPAICFHTGIIPSTGQVFMSPVHVQDVADAFVRSLEDSATIGKNYALGGPEDLSWSDMLHRIAATVGKRKMILPMPIGFMKLGAMLFDWLPFFPVTRDQLTMLAEGNVADPVELRKLLGRDLRPFDSANLSYLRERASRAGP